MTEEEENVNRLLVEYEQHRAQIEALQEGIGLIDSSIIQIETTIHSLNAMGSLKKGHEILLPVGSDSFLRATITDSKHAIVGIGADVAVKKTIKEAVAELETRKGDLERVRKERAQALERSVQTAQQMTPKVQEILARSQSGG